MSHRSTYRKPARLMLIEHQRSGVVAECRRASSLAQALREFAKHRGMHKTIIVGNTLTHGDEVFVAKENQ